jgi:hypothetical protein
LALNLPSQKDWRRFWKRQRKAERRARRNERALRWNIHADSLSKVLNSITGFIKSLFGR